MIGEKLMEEPKVMKDCWEIFKAYRLVLPSNHDYIFENAIQLVQVNNEVYYKLNPEPKRGGLVNPDGGDYPLKWMSKPVKD